MSGIGENPAIEGKDVKAQIGENTQNWEVPDEKGIYNTNLKLEKEEFVPEEPQSNGPTFEQKWPPTLDGKRDDKDAVKTSTT